ncbi:MAG: sulfurtransferase TusA [Porticoccaceae bacterium]|nr:sulfurtransferase TusA [Porticoccaceae bacterium]
MKRSRVLRFFTLLPNQSKRYAVTEREEHRQVNEVVDTSGLRCPEPVMMLHNVIRKVAAGDIIKVIATDPSTQRDIPKFCRYLGHELLEEIVTEDSYLYFIRRA